MKHSNQVMLVGAVILAIIGTGCATSGGAGVSPDMTNKIDKKSQVEVNNPTVSLADYLRQVPGVHVRGSGSNVQIVIQGVGTIMGDTSPLFYIDRVRIGRSYDRVQSMLNMNDVDNIEVVKGVQASAYGIEGANGIIIINSKSTYQ